MAVWEPVEGKESTVGVASRETGPKIRQFPGGGEEIISLLQNVVLAWSGLLPGDPAEASEPAETAKKKPKKRRMSG